MNPKHKEAYNVVDSVFTPAMATIAIPIAVKERHKVRAEDGTVQEVYACEVLDFDTNSLPKVGERYVCDASQVRIMTPAEQELYAPITGIRLERPPEDNVTPLRFFAGKMRLSNSALSEILDFGINKTKLVLKQQYISGEVLFRLMYRLEIKVEQVDPDVIIPVDRKYIQEIYDQAMKARVEFGIADDTANGES